jgi:cysteinyl-tRNA synthetase
LTTAALEAKRLAQLEKGRVAPVDMFRPPNVAVSLYSEWDESGLPIKDGEGKEVSKSLMKKLAKEFKVQEKLHADWLNEYGKTE